MCYREGETIKRFVKFSTLGFVKSQAMNFETDKHANIPWKPLICIKVWCTTFEFKNEWPSPPLPFFQNDFGNNHHKL